MLSEIVYSIEDLDDLQQLLENLFVRIKKEITSVIPRRISQSNYTEMMMKEEKTITKTDYRLIISKCFSVLHKILKNEKLILNKYNEIEKYIEPLMKHIREQNGGLCNIYNNWGSLCTTDMNITTDLDGNFISYDEMAITNIYYDDANSFVKEKKSSLVDNTGKITREEKDEYRDNLKKLLNKLEPHMKEEILFPREKFVELIDLLKNPESSIEGEINEESITESSTKRRRLSPSSITDPTQYIRQKELFQIDSLGVKIIPKEIVLFNDGDEVDRIPADAFDNIDDVDFELYENDAEEAVQEEEDMYDWENDEFED